MARLARFKTLAKLGPGGRRIPATVIINRDTELVQVRPLRRRRTYDLLLSDVAEMVMNRIVLAERREKKLIKRRRPGSR